MPEDEAHHSNNEQIMRFFRKGRPFRFSRGEIILRGNSEPTGVYCVDKGQVKVYSINDAGDEYIHIIYRHGEIFPMIWAFKNIYRNVFYEAMESSLLWMIPRDTFLKFAQSSLQISYGLLQQMIEQFNTYADRIDNLEYKRADERVIYRLLFLAGRFGTRHGGSMTIEARLTQQDIARSINVARESVARALE